MATWMKLCLGLACCASLTSGFVVYRFGTCPSVPVEQNFDVRRYMGKWYEYESFPTNFNANTKCTSANYTLLSPSTVSVFNSAVREIRFWFWYWTEPTTARGSATILNAADPAKLYVNLGPQRPITGEEVSNYMVLDTDYTNFAIVYSCEELIPGWFGTESAFILTRARGMRPFNIDEIYRTLQSNNIDTRYFRRTDQTSCSN